jgi:hypothetical protein
MNIFYKIEQMFQGAAKELMNFSNGCKRRAPLVIPGDDPKPRKHVPVKSQIQPKPDHKNPEISNGHKDEEPTQQERIREFWS